MTFSIVARDPGTGALGVATATGGPVVGSLVPHARAGVGAIATQAMTNPFYGLEGLDLLASGSDPEAALDRLVEDDAARDQRQCIIVDGKGHTAAWTGPACISYAGALMAPGIVAAGNMLVGPEVITALLLGFELTEGALEDRLIGALRRANAAGGDVRGIRSAALKVYIGQSYPAVDLRSDWSLNPLEDLAVILAETRAPGYADFFRDVPSR
ncbi:DUF1028 domain-containing protein [Devosia sp. RR2S18]|uniref:DUF1028 domain-containing protein n=1 Tax=Devosia rhizosphaerae TaxID=3049774 RepID=UPI00254239CA|nr:DUF1028 domain-containing protein [Devosia sp. RR2S18]WIJ23964.1 DUF1028 domain-containing protein [Devosia sp. RR2S18]